VKWAPVTVKYAPLFTLEGPERLAPELGGGQELVGVGLGFGLGLGLGLGLAFGLGLGLFPGVGFADGPPLAVGERLADGVGLGSVPGAITVSGSRSGHELFQHTEMWCAPIPMSSGTVIDRLREPFASALNGNV